MTAPTAWAHLPNAVHIDAVLAHLKAHPERWDITRDAAWSAARDAAWGITRDAARSAAWSAARAAARAAAWDALAALIAYDDCAYILSLPSGAVRLMCSVGDQKAMLLYPAVLVMEVGA